MTPFLPLFRLLIGIVLSGFLAHGTFATTHTVTNLNDNGAGSLRDTIAASADGDTIDFNVTGTITLGSELLISHNITITGPAGGITISGNNSFRVFNVMTSAGTVTFSGLTISNGNATGNGNGNGGGILTNTGLVNVTNCKLSGNMAEGNGGGIAIGGGGGFVTNSTLDDNTAGGVGGGIYYAGPTSLSVRSCTLSNNSAQSGGGIFTDALGGARGCMSSTAPLAATLLVWAAAFTTLA